MSSQFEFKATNSFEKRQTLSRKILQQHPERIPVIVECDKNCDFEARTRRFLPSYEITAAHLMAKVRESLTIRPDQAIFLFCNDSVLVPMVSKVGELYDKYADEDGFLYVRVALENTFGSSL